MNHLDHPLVDKLIALALEEDGVSNDLTTRATNPDPNKLIRATIVAKKPTVAAGSPIVKKVLASGGAAATVQVSVLHEEGSLLAEKAPWIILQGPAANILTLERTILNFLMRMCGIATRTREMVKAVEGTNCKILHIRKTAPGHRYTDVYGALTGGAHAHRISLAEAIVVKENHIRSAKSMQHLKDGIKAVRGEASFVEIEVSNFIELKYAMENKPDRVLLDNFSIADVAKAVNLFGSAVELEASGNITLDNVRAYAETGVDYISSGAITHSAPAADLSLLFDFT